jgi:hypothetical protein
MTVLPREELFNFLIAQKLGRITRKSFSHSSYIASMHPGWQGRQRQSGQDGARSSQEGATHALTA